MAEEDDLRAEAVGRARAVAAGQSPEAAALDAMQREAVGRSRDAMVLGEGEAARGVANAPSAWGSAQQLWEGLTQGLPTMWQAKKESLASGKPFDEVMGKYRKQREEYEAAHPLRSAVELGGASALGAIPAMGLGEAVAAPGLARAGAAVTRAAPGLLDNALGRTAGAVATGARQGATAGLIQSPLGKDSVGEQMGEGATMGAGLGPLGHALGGAFRSKISPEDARVAQRMIEMGVPLRTADMPGAPKTARMASSVVGPSNEEKLRPYARALASTFGEQSDRIDYPTIMNARARIGKEFDDLASMVHIPQAEPGLHGDLASIRGDVSKLDPKIYAPVLRALDNVEAMGFAGPMDGEAVKSLRGPGGSVGSIARATDGTIRHFGQEIEHAVMEAAGRNSTPEAMQRLSVAKQQYKNMLIADKISDPTTGLADPTKLLRPVTAKYGSADEARAGDIGVLAQGGKRFLDKPEGRAKPGSSGHTATKVGATAVLGSAAGEQLAEHGGAILHHLPAGAELAIAGGAGLGAAGLGHGAYAQTASGTANMLNAARGAGGLPWWTGRGVQPMIPAATALEGQKW